MGVNNAENGIDRALISKINQLEQDFNDFRTTPQKIGTGSIEFAIFGSDTSIDSIRWNSFTIVDGQTVNLYMEIDYSSYGGLPAIPAQSVMDVFVDVRIDTDDEAHHYPFGSNATTRISVWNSLTKSHPWSTVDKIRRVYIQLTNVSGASHVYFVRANLFWPRPPLKKL
ncbi:hypothetical protein BJF87_21500 [Gordonia sp. CNJ-863]|uniref:hypothetical protein n=1 Tax=Gordonia sp. CNJ-863 TaxID=1904963 RepID=UPI00095BD288|nr:hypothetical protein [Gordonia sp. CNJ-863]OLT47794.1 hypothetical protein BJF87_21500 [Gordonia sp. CNJ-863]